MNIHKAQAIFTLAGIEATAIVMTRNEYWPDHPDYDAYRQNSPWWKVTTPHGEVTIGWRKRVIEISWDGIDGVEPLTRDNVTKGEHLIHANNYAKAVQYMTAWRRNLPRDHVVAAGPAIIYTIVNAGPARISEICEAIEDVETPDVIFATAHAAGFKEVKVAGLENLQPVMEAMSQYDGEWAYKGADGELLRGSLSYINTAIADKAS